MPITDMGDNVNSPVVCLPALDLSTAIRTEACPPPLSIAPSHNLQQRRAVLWPPSPLLVFVMYSVARPPKYADGDLCLNPRHTHRPTQGGLHLLQRPQPISHPDTASSPVSAVHTPSSTYGDLSMQSLLSSAHLLSSTSPPSPMSTPSWATPSSTDSPSSIEAPSRGSTPSSAQTPVFTRRPPNLQPLQNSKTKKLESMITQAASRRMNRRSSRIRDMALFPRDSSRGNAISRSKCK